MQWYIFSLAYLYGIGEKSIHKFSDGETPLKKILFMN